MEFLGFILYILIWVLFLLIGISDFEFEEGEKELKENSCKDGLLACLKAWKKGGMENG